MNVQIIIHISLILMTKLLEKARTLELQETSGTQIEAEKNKLDIDVH